MKTTAPAPVQTTARVVERRSVGEYTLLSFEAPQIAAAAQPGQFVSLAQEAPGHLLRRPFSVLGVDGDVVRIAFDVVGPGTEWIAARKAGDVIEVIGPLGAGFREADGDGAILVGGGYGAAPLFFLAERLRGVRTHMILGAARAGRLLDAAGAARIADEVTLTTEDGSQGNRGLVTDVLNPSPSDVVYACGPMPMLAAVARKASEAGARCQVAVEEFMACGIGVCWTCVVPVRADGGVRYARSCSEGPVFDAEALAWA